MISQDIRIQISQYQADLREHLKLIDPIEKLYSLNILERDWKDRLGFRKADIVQHLILISAPENTGPDIKTSFTLQEILSLNNECNQWISPNLLRAGGGLWILAGQPKSFKSLLGAYELATALTIRGEFLGSPCAMGKVLIFQKEESPFTIKRRLAAKGFEVFNKKADRAISENLIQIETDWKIDDIFSLREKIRQFKPTLVIFDSLRAISAELGISENSAEFVKYIYVLQKTLIFEQVSGLLIHHANKASDGKTLAGMAGSLGIGGASDGALLLSTDPNVKDAPLDLRTIPRDGIPIHYQLVMEKDPVTNYSRFRKIKELGISSEIIILEKKIMRFLSTSDLETISKLDIARFLAMEVTNGNLTIALDRLVESYQITEMKSEDESSISGFRLLYSIPSNSPWVGFEGDAHPEYREADRLLACRTKAEIDALSEQWKSEYDERFKLKVWSCISSVEQENVFSILRPLKFSVGDKVVHIETLLELTIQKCKPDFANDTWNYEVEGERIFPQEVLRYFIEAETINPDSL